MGFVLLSAAPDRGRPGWRRRRKERGKGLAAGGEGRKGCYLAVGVEGVGGCKEGTLRGITQNTHWHSEVDERRERGKKERGRERGRKKQCNGGRERERLKGRRRDTAPSETKKTLLGHSHPQH